MHSTDSEYEHVEQERPGRGRRVNRSWAAGLLIGLVLLCLVGAFGLGLRFRPQGPSVEEQRTAVVPTWAEVQKREVTDAVSAAGQVEPPSSSPLASPKEGLVTRQTLKDGQLVTPGVLVGMVNDEPVFALPGPLPLYRDLHHGDRGDDVRALAAGLAAAGYQVDGTGEVTDLFLRAVTALYRSEGLDVPRNGLREVDHSNFIVIPRSAEGAMDIAGVGQRVDAEHPLAKVRTGEPTVSFTVDMDHKEQTRVGSIVDVATSKGRTEGEVTKVGAFQPGENGADGGYPVTVTVQDESILVQGQSASISGRGDRTQVLAVPLTAVREESGGSYVEIQAASDGGEEEKGAPKTSKVTVRVLRSADGYAAVEGDLQVGQKVLVR